MITKRCPKCGEDKPATREHFHAGAKQGRLQSWCKACANANSKMVSRSKILSGQKKYKQPGGFVYVMACVGLSEFKVGWSADPKRRLIQVGYDVGHPVTLEWTANGDRGTETLLHDSLAPWRTHGEWFTDCAEARATLYNQAYWLGLKRRRNGRASSRRACGVIKGLRYST